MNTHFAICKSCGYTTNAQRSSGRKCPFGHGELLVLDHRYAKLLSNKNDKGSDKLRKLAILQKQFRVNDEEQRIGIRSRIGRGFISNTQLESFYRRKQIPIK